MSPRGKRILGYAISLTVMVVLLFFLFRSIKWSDLMDGLRSCRLVYVGFAMAAGVLAFWFRGMRSRQLIQPLDPTIKTVTAFNSITIGNLANFAVPRSAEFVRCGIVTRRSKTNADALNAKARDGEEKKEGVTYDMVLGTIVMDRVWDLITLFVLAALIIALRWGKLTSLIAGMRQEGLLEGQHRSTLWWLVVVGIVVVLAVAVWLIIKFKDRSKFCGAICRFCSRAAQGFMAALRMKQVWKFILLTLLIWSMYWAMAVFSMMAIPDLAGLSPVDALFLAIVGSFGWLIPVPGGFGAYHFIVALALQYVYGLTFDLGIIFATISHESQAVMMIFVGLFSYLYETFKKSDNSVVSTGGEN